MIRHKLAWTPGEVEMGKTGNLLDGMMEALRTLLPGYLISIQHCLDFGETRSVQSDDLRLNGFCVGDHICSKDSTWA